MIVQALIEAEGVSMGHGRIGRESANLAVSNARCDAADGVWTRESQFRPIIRRSMLWNCSCTLANDQGAYDDAAGMFSVWSAPGGSESGFGQS